MLCRKLVDRDTLLFGTHVTPLEIEPLQRRRTPGAVHDDVRLKRLAAAIDLGRHAQTGAAALDRLDRRPSLKVDAQRAGALEELRDQVRIESPERALAAIEHDHLGVRPCRDVGELERDVSAADEQDAVRQIVELEKAVARGDVLGAGDRQRHRLRTARDHEVLRLQTLAADLEGVVRDEARGASIRSDAVVGEALLFFVRHRIGVGALKAHQARPVDAEAGSAMPLPCIRRAASTTSAPRLRIFFGSQPRNWQVPPYGSSSMIATDQPAARQRFATVLAAVPVPTTTRSTVLSITMSPTRDSW
jgi:hypothetical protein